MKLSTGDHMIPLLLDCPLFVGLDEDELRELLQSATARIRHFRRGDLIAQAGEELFFLNIVLEGSVKGEMVDYAGKVIRIEDILPPRPLAPAFLFGKQNRFPVNITAGEDVTLLAIPRDNFLKMMQSSERILRNFVDIVSSRGQFLSSKIKYLSFTTIKGKLAQYLLDLAAKTGSEQVNMKLSQAQLAELFGVARPSVGRAISDMNRDGIIRTRGREVELLDRRELSALLK